MYSMRSIAIIPNCVGGDLGDDGDIVNNIIRGSVVAGEGGR